jgi:formylglycine-generating enzyme required for sulfatase activity
MSTLLAGVFCALVGFGALRYLLAVAIPHHSLLLSPGLATISSAFAAAALTDSNAEPVATAQALTNTLHFPMVLSIGPIFLPLILMPPTDLPVAPQPVHGALDQSPNAYLTWQVSNASGAALSYEVYLEANNPTPTLLISPGAIRAQSFDPQTFAVDTDYYWRVVAVSANSERTEGPVWRFRTLAMTYPPDVETMLTVPAGEFLMGCDQTNPGSIACANKDTPLHPVYLEAYAIDKYEVTNLQYRACVDAGACERPRKTGSHKRTSYFYDANYDYFPVLYVSWWNAQDYCKWVDKRLPTEAEWEKATRGVIDTRAWPWGNEFSDCSRLNNTLDMVDDEEIVCVGETTQVGSYPSGASPYGAMDMSGNVFEWVYDNYDEYYYRRAPYYNPMGPDKSKDPDDEPFFVIRGGSYRPRWSYPRTFHRHWGHHGDRVGGDAPYYRNDQVGFRCVRTLPPP